MARSSRSRYVTLSEVKEALKQSEVNQERYVVQQLAKLGYDAIMYAFRQGHASGSYDFKNPPRDGKWRNRTGNLHDGFGSAVYVAGTLIQSSIRFVGGEISRRRDPLTMETGREALMNFFNNRHYGSKKSDIVLVCVSAMYYTKYLENGTHKGKYVIRVISGARDYIDQNYNKYLGDKKLALVLRGIKPISNEKVGLL